MTSNRYVPRGTASRRTGNDYREEGERVARGQVRENGRGTRGRNATVEAVRHRADSSRSLADRRD